jgi:hypothetical protein
MLFWRWRDLRLYSHAAIGFAALALVVVDASVAGVRAGAASPPTPAPSVAAHPHALGVGHGLRAEAVASGGGHIWVLAKRSQRGPVLVEEIDPSSHQTITSIQVSGASSHVFYGAGRVWATGGTQISAVDPLGGRVSTIQLGGGTVRSMAFARSTAYAAVIGRDEVLAITGGKRLRTRTIEEHGGPLAVVAVPRAIEVTNNEMNLVPVILPGADTSFLAALQLGRPVIAAAGRRAAWVRRGRQLVRETLGADNRPARRYVATPGAPLRVVMAGDGGCYVSLTSVPRSRINLAYFSRKALSARHPRPTDVHAGARITDFALDPAGGVDFIDRSGALKRWEPAI